jgi:nitrate reductase NapE component
MRKWTAAIPVAGAYILSAALYPRLAPSARADFSPLVPFHVATGDVSRTALVLLLPTTALTAFILVSLISRIRGPVKGLPEWWINENLGSESIARFEPTFTTIIFAAMSLLLLIHVAFVGAYMGWPSWTFQLETAILGVGMIAAGNVFPRVKPNWIMGMRTKRTLSDPTAWARAHRALGGLVMAAGTSVLVLSLLAPRYALVWWAVSLLLSFVLAYSLGTRSEKPSRVSSLG